MEHCIYCGCEDLALSVQDVFTCCQCGLMFTRAELDKDNKRLKSRDHCEGTDDPDDIADDTGSCQGMENLGIAEIMPMGKMVEHSGHDTR